MGEQTIILFLLLFSGAEFCLAESNILSTPSQLLVEYLSEPIGVDTLSPRFSWSLEQLTDTDFGASQHGFQIQLFAGSFSHERKPATPFYDSGFVASEDFHLIAYPSTAPALISTSSYSWHVRSFDMLNASTNYSSLATFQMGLLSRDDWKGATWITGGKGKNLVRAAFALPSAATVTKATAFVAGLGYFQLFCNGQQVGLGNQGQSRKPDGGWTRYAYRVTYTAFDVTACLQPTPAPQRSAALGIWLGNSWFNSDGWYARGPYPYPGAANGGGYAHCLHILTFVIVNFVCD